MRPLHLIYIAVIVAGSVSCTQEAPAPSDRPKDDPTATVAANDSEMNAAIAKARSTLSTFYEHWKHPGPVESDFNLKLRIEEDGHAEHFWMGDLEGSPGKLTGVVNDTPEWVHTVKEGQRIPIPDDHISDWMYVRDGKIVGNQTVRALFKEMSPEEVKNMKAKLADP